MLECSTYVLFQKFYGFRSYIQVLIYFEFVQMVSENALISLTCSCPVFPVPLVEETLFQCICLLLLLYIDHRYVGLFLGCLFCSIYLCVCFVLVPYCFDYSSFVVQSEVRKCDSSCSLKIVLDRLVQDGRVEGHALTPSCKSTTITMNC